MNPQSGAQSISYMVATAGVTLLDKGNVESLCAGVGLLAIAALLRYAILKLETKPNAG